MSTKSCRSWIELREMFRREPTRLVWARRDTRWDVYPQREPMQLVAHNWEGWWAPLPDGSWFKTPTSYVIAEDASAAALQGSWDDTDRVPRYLRA